MGAKFFSRMSFTNNHLWTEFLLRHCPTNDNFENFSLINEEDVVQIALNELQQRHLLKNDELMITQTHSEHVYYARKKNGYPSTFCKRSFFAKALMEDW
jgi:hypothetical protein